MAGKRQHFIPQFLQRGFASHITGEQAFTWVYRKSVEPFNTNIRNVGVEGFFYSKGEDPELDADSAITEFEREFGPLITDLRASAPSAIASTERIALLLAHLEARTRHIRQSFLITGTHLLDELMKFASDAEVFGRYFRRSIERDPSLIQDAIAKELEKNGISQELLPQIMEISKPLLEQMMPEAMNEMSVFAQIFRASLPSFFNESAKSGHIKALVKTLAPEKKVGRFSELKFNVVYCGKILIPLGDSAVLFHVSGDRSFKPFLEKDDKLLAVLLPIDKHCVLVGTQSEYEVDFLCLRSEIARCSLEYFISSQSPPENNDLLTQIGENAHLLSRDQIEEMVGEIINE